MNSGILLVGHGTRDQAGAAEFNELTERLRQQVPDQPVEGCFLELRPPTIEQGWRRLIDAGVGHVHVAPLLLFAAGHAKNDIPAAVQQCADQTPGVSFDFARPLSRHPLVIELAAARVSETLAEATANISDLAPQDVALVMVGRGSYDPCAQTDMRLLSALVADRLPFAEVRTAFYAMAQPPLAEVLDQVAALPQVRAVIVQPHLLFCGQLRDSIRRQVQEARQRHPHLTFWDASHLGPDPRIASALATRVGKSTLVGSRS